MGQQRFRNMICRAGGLAAALLLQACDTLNVGEPPADPAPEHTVSVSLSGNGAGTVTSQPEGIACSTTGGTVTGVCEAPFSEGTQVTLTAVPATTGDVSFEGWSQVCSGTSVCIVTVDAARAIGATFSLPIDFTLTVDLSGFGTGAVASNPAGIDCNAPDADGCSAEFREGTNVTLTATPATGMTFGSWSGHCTGASAACAIAMSGNRAVDALFVNPQLVAAQIGPAGGQIESVDGDVVITVPPGALGTSETITIETLDPHTLPIRYLGTVLEPGDPPTGDVDEPLRGAWQVGPAGLTFTLPAEIQVTVDAPDGNASPYRFDPPEGSIEPLDVDGIEKKPADRVQLKTRLEKAGLLAVAPDPPAFSVTVPSPSDGSSFLWHQLFTTSIRAEGNYSTKVFSGEVEGVSLRRVVTAHQPDGFTLKQSTEEWIGGVDGVVEVPAQLVSGTGITISAPSACNVAPGIGIFAPALTATMTFRSRLYADNQLVNDNTNVAERMGFASKQVSCVSAQTAEVTQVFANGGTQNTVGKHLCLENSGTNPPSDNALSVGATLPTQSTCGVVTGGSFSIYQGTASGSTVFLLVYGSSGSIPGSSNMTEARAREILSAFTTNGTPRDAGGPLIDWPSLFEALGIDASKVCGGRVVLDLESDQGGPLPGYNTAGELEGSGQFTGETGGICQNFAINLRSRIFQD